MTKSIHIRTAAITTAFAALAGLAMFARTGGALARNVLFCDGASRQSDNLNTR